MNILLYAFARSGYGHSIRISRIGYMLSKIGFNIALASDQPTKHYPGNNIQHHSIPYPNWKNTFNKEERKNKIRDIVKQFKPDVLIVDYYPFCEKDIDDEIDYLISKCKTYTKTYVASVFRGHLSGLTGFNKALERFQNRAKKIDHLFIAAEKHAFYINPLLTLIQNIFQGKMSFIGIIRPNSYDLQPPPDQPYDIVVQFGGCCDQVHDDVIAIARSLTYLSFYQTFRVLFSLGQNTSDSLFYRVREAIHFYDNIKLTKWENNISRYMNKSRIVISSAGYNTCAELSVMNNHKILLPRIVAEGNRSEQVLNAVNLQKQCRVEKILEPNVNHIELGKLIERLLLKESSHEPTRIQDSAYQTFVMTRQFIVPSVPMRLRHQTFG